MAKDPIPWFKFYPDKFMHGVRGLTAQEVGVYQMMLCRIYEENGPVEYHVLRLATYCGMRKNTFQKTIEKLIDLGKLTLKDGLISNDRADTEISSRANDLKISSRGGKVSAEKRQQNQQKTSSGGQVKANHKDKEEDIKELSNDSSKKADAFPSNEAMRQFVLMWNEFADAHDLAKVKDLTTARRASLRQRMLKAGSLQDIVLILTSTAEMPHLMGENDRGWKMDFDFFIRESAFTKICEGVYVKRKPIQQNSNKPRSMQDIAADRWKRKAAEKGAIDDNQSKLIDGTVRSLSSAN